MMVGTGGGEVALAVSEAVSEACDHAEFRARAGAKVQFLADLPAELESRKSFISNVGGINRRDRRELDSWSVPKRPQYRGVTVVLPPEKEFASSGP